MKNHNSQFLKQATILASAGLIARLLGFLYRIPMQNILGDDGTGVYGASYNLYMFFFVLSSAGIPAAIAKMVSTRMALKQYENALKVFKVSLVISGFLGFVFMLIMFFFAPQLSSFFSSYHVVYSLRTLAPTVFIVSIMSVYRGYFQGLGNSMPTAISQIIEQLLNAIFSVILIYILIDEGIGIAAAGGTAASGIGAFFGLIFILFVYTISKRRHVLRITKSRKNYKQESSKKLGLELILTAIPIIAGTAIFTITNIIDTRMVVDILQDTGFTYSEAWMLYGQLNGKYVVITTLPVAVAAAIATALIPSISRSVTLKEIKSTRHKINMALRTAMLICIPAAMGIGVMANQILLFLFPNNPDGGILLQVGALSVLFLALSQVATGILHGLHILKVPILAALIGATIKIFLNIWLIAIPSINIIGAVISTTVCYIIASTINLTKVYKATNSKMDVSNIFIKPIFASVVMGLVCFVVYHSFFLLFPSNTISLILAIFISIITYFSIMICIGGITKTELHYLPLGNKIFAILQKLGIIVK